ncbi:MAG TPA: hypothetical protein VME46_02710 [Acidimicrobiales bacterium]|nr:hypothetical protein [Acidimicrobiales bacterium]
MKGTEQHVSSVIPDGMGERHSRSPRLSRRCRAVGLPCLVLLVSGTSGAMVVDPAPSLAASTSHTPYTAESFRWSAPVTLTPSSDFMQGMGISCPTTRLCVVVGEPDQNPAVVAISTDPFSSKPTWVTSSVDYHGIDMSAYNEELFGLSCPSTTLCVAGDGEGNIVTSTGPTARSASKWTVTQVLQADGAPADGGGPINSVSCPSPKVCVATGGDSILTSADPGSTSPTWTVTQMYGLGGGTVSCPSTSLCVAVGENPPGDPPGIIAGAIMAFDASSGTPVDTATTIVPNNGLVPDAVSCPTTTWCLANVANHQEALTFSPRDISAYRLTPLDFPINEGISLGVICASTKLCFGWGGTAFLVSDHPFPTPTWSVVPGLPNDGLPWIPNDSPDAMSCPTPRQCAIVGAGAGWPTSVITGTFGTGTQSTTTTRSV